MGLRIYPVTSRNDLKRYIHLPAQIHRDHPNWVPPIYMDEWYYYNPKKNDAFQYSDTIQFLAEDDGRLVGRIMGIINKNYNQRHHQRHARFCYLETYNDFEVAKALLEAVENWAIGKGMQKIVGPLGFSDKDPQGLMVEGFDEPIVLSTSCNFPYMVNFVERAGYIKEIDLVVYRVPVPDTIPPFYQRILERTLRKANGLRMVDFKTRRQIKPYVHPVLRLLNDTFKHIYGFNPLIEREMDEFAERYLMILDPRFLKVIVNQSDEVVAFILGIPDISEGIRKSRGYMLPFGIFQVLAAQRKTKLLSLLLGGIHENYRNIGLDTWLGPAMLQEAQKAGLRQIDSHLELETNHKMRAEMEKMGGVVYKRYRIFQKSLQPA